MKIAIQGHLTRGKEVIQILESLGGINRMYHTGRFVNYFYYISSDDNTIAWTCIRSEYFKVYTLEEFKKEFPFKIGDKVIHSYTPNFVGTVVDIKFDDHIPYRVNIKGKICTCGTVSLKPYKEMERNVTLTFDKAKEWYKKGGELREVALQAFIEEELNPLPRSWEDYCKYNSTLTTSFSSCAKYDAFVKLEHLRDCWLGGWTPKWDTSEKWCIRLYKNQLHVGLCTDISRFLTFPTKEMAEEFLKCFRDLIEVARNLI